MTRIEYDLCRQNHPELKLMNSYWVGFWYWKKIEAITVEELIAYRAQSILNGCSQFDPEAYWDPTGNEN